MVQNTDKFYHADCENQYQKLFCDEHIKAKCFDMIAAAFYDKNFGTSSKADTELLMFHQLLEQMISQNRNDDGVLDYAKCSDYVISKILGISESKVRNLKIKRNLAFPEDYKWIDSFAAILNDSRYTEKNGNRIQMNIPDPNVYLEIKNFVETKGGAVEFHLNPRILDMRVEYLYDFAVLLEEDGTQSEIQEKALKIIRKNKVSHGITKALSIGSMLIKGDINAADCAESIETLFSKRNKIIGFLRGEES